MFVRAVGDPYILAWSRSRNAWYYFHTGRHSSQPTRPDDAVVRYGCVDLNSTSYEYIEFNLSPWCLTCTRTYRETLKRGRLYWHWEMPGASRPEALSAPASGSGESEVVKSPEQFEELLACTREAVERGYSRSQRQVTASAAPTSALTSESKTAIPIKTVAGSKKKSDWSNVLVRLQYHFMLEAESAFSEYSYIFEDPFFNLNVSGPNVHVHTKVYFPKFTSLLPEVYILYLKAASIPLIISFNLCTTCMSTRQYACIYKITLLFICEFD